MCDEDNEYDDDEYKEFYIFKNFYTDCLLENEDQLNEPFYNGNHKLIIIKHEPFWDEQNNSIYYYIKNNPNNIITYKELYDEIDKQSLDYKHILEYEDHRFIELISKQTDIQYELCCGS
tara:strand:- start:46 stop:402 length:357 start_codon:yes stop_codon:yes gene_type:complete